MPGSDHLRDRNIPYHIVQLVNEDGRLEPPTPLSHIIASIDSKTHFVELVNEDPQPLVKIKNKTQEYIKMKEWKKRQKEVAASNIQKEIQMTWGVESGDLAHKLKKVRKELEKGNRVDLVYAPKANQVMPSPVAMENRIKETVEILSDIAKEWAPRRFEKGVAVLFLKLADKPPKSTKPS
jgi:translation initiation factor IF-3